MYGLLGTVEGDDNDDVFDQSCDTQQPLRRSNHNQKQVDVDPQVSFDATQRGLAKLQPEAVEKQSHGLHLAVDQETMDLCEAQPKSFHDQGRNRNNSSSQPIRGGKNLHRRNVFFLCGGFFFIYVTFQAEQNLQSSLNSAGSSGVLGLSVLYACMSFSF